ncbi:MAG: carboxypeptidase M32 [Planctomycetes bacterium]|nr:carboxypeptidase M32 [Planctomycetota bacterium]
MRKVDATYLDLLTQLRDAAVLGSCASVLGWDEQTFLPPAGANHRAEQLATLAGLTHERATSPRIGELLTELEQCGALGDETSAMAVNVREARHSYDRVTKLPRALVEELSRTTTLAQTAWVTARKKSDFAEFQPWLERMVGLKRQQAEALGYSGGVPYDALLDEFEPGVSSREIAATFAPLRDELVKLVDAIQGSSRRPNVSLLTRRFPLDAQRQFAENAARKIGFDFEAGRLDVAPHPFCSGLGPGDCRLTTRYNEQHFPGAFFGVLHEAGHGLYEQGLDRTAFGSPMGETVSLGIHESQSRLWENFVGRSRAFWQHFFAPAQQAFPEALTGVNLADWYAAINDVRPSFIRVEADEVTYNLHIMLRFELEQPLISGDLKPADVPAVWNETFSRYFGLTPADAACGCLQDIHWSAGLIGYFPTYSLGNMYAAQFYEAAQRDLGDLPTQFARGEFHPLLDWLRKNIHSRGKQLRAGELIQRVTGAPLSHQALITHLHRKFDGLFGLT